MWKWLHPYAKSETAYRIAGLWLPWFAVFSVVSFAIGLVWGLAFAPADYQQGDAFRIIYIHVPAAIMSMGAYSSMAIAAFIGLVWQIKVANMAVSAIAPVGAVFTFIALFTGAAWGKPMWGTWWDWDPRLTTELILLFLYLGVIGLYNAIDDRRAAARAAGLLAIVGVVLLPIIRYSVEWWDSLHQGQTIRVFGESSLDASMAWPLWWMVIGTKFWFAGSLLLRARADNLRREAGKAWVARTSAGTGETGGRLPGEAAR